MVFDNEHAVDEFEKIMINPVFDLLAEANSKQELLAYKKPKELSSDDISNV